MPFDDLVLARAGADFVGNAVLVESGLRNLITSSYDLAGQTPQGPFSYSATELSFGGFGFSRVETLDSGGAPVHSEISIAVAADDPARIDMLWRGHVRAGASYPLAMTDIETVAALTIDDLDVAIGPPLPSNPNALEAARRTALLARMQGQASDAAAFDLASVEQLLATASVTSVAELLRLDGGSARFAQLVLSITAIPGTIGNQVRSFPVAAAILVRDVAQPGVTLATMLQVSRAVRERLRYGGFDLLAEPGLPTARTAVIWIVDASWFDEDGWPGTGGSAAALRADRIVKAGAWLAAQGVALNPITLN